MTVNIFLGCLPSFCLSRFAYVSLSLSLSRSNDDGMFTFSVEENDRHCQKKLTSLVFIFVQRKERTRDRENNSKQLVGVQFRLRKLERIGGVGASPPPPDMGGVGSCSVVKVLINISLSRCKVKICCSASAKS